MKKKLKLNSYIMFNDQLSDHTKQRTSSGAESSSSTQKIHNNLQDAKIPYRAHRSPTKVYKFCYTNHKSSPYPLPYFSKTHCNIILQSSPTSYRSLSLQHLRLAS
jgi:hypothetical protein